MNAAVCAEILIGADRGVLPMLPQSAISGRRGLFLIEIRQRTATRSSSGSPAVPAMRRAC